MPPCRREIRREFLWFRELVKWYLRDAPRHPVGFLSVGGRPFLPMAAGRVLPMVRGGLRGGGGLVGVGVGFVVVFFADRVEGTNPQGADTVSTKEATAGQWWMDDFMVLKGIRA